MTEPAVVVDRVSKSFRVYQERNQSIKAAVLQRGRAKYTDFHALQDVSFQIPKGSTFGLLGRNGSGKSTLLKVMARILNPDSGSIAMDGRVAAMLEVGSGFHPELSGRENVYLNGAILGMRKEEIDRKFDRIVEFSGVGDFIDQPVKNYSSGMYVRLGFAVSIHVEPDILLVDEVLAVGDMDFQEKCLEKFAQFRDEGRTVVVVSHGLEQMRSFCDQAAWLDHGVVQDVGPARRIVDEYADSSHAAKPVDGGGTRFGSGEMLVERIELLAADGGDAGGLQTGDGLLVRVHYRAHETVERPVLGVSIGTREGIHVWGTHGFDAGWVPERIEPGTGTIDVHVSGLPLLPGMYDVSTVVQDFRRTVIYDAFQRGASFTLQRGERDNAGGIVALDATFGGLEPEQPLVPLSRLR
ncbi:ABC transporter ATP-binding protein [Agrococcus sp. SGAir0287]|uniref:ABC transporter ATP-binding protein n=1 Tax=Agrococcus sp. SGAir0287 TaxID=2070347 RepID=UPI0020C74F56|nr:ABC transporter ATP-binding protein [Agrococcus sp. SGAir0287]